MWTLFFALMALGGWCLFILKEAAYDEVRIERDLLAMRLADVQLQRRADLAWHGVHEVVVDL